MDQKDKDILKKGLENPGKDFTANLMQQLNAEEKALSNVLSKHGSMETSADFTAQLMQQLEGKKPAKPYVPVISKKVWIGIAAAFIGMVILAFSFGQTGTGELSISEDVGNVANTIGSIFTHSAVLTYVLPAILLLSIGLVLEQRLAKK